MSAHGINFFTRAARKRKKKIKIVGDSGLAPAQTGIGPQVSIPSGTFAGTLDKARSLSKIRSLSELLSKF